MIDWGHNYCKLLIIPKLIRSKYVREVPTYAVFDNILLMFCWSSKMSMAVLKVLAWRRPILQAKYTIATKLMSLGEIQEKVGMHKSGHKIQLVTVRMLVMHMISIKENCDTEWNDTTQLHVSKLHKCYSVLNFSLILLCCHTETYSTNSRIEPPFPRI